MIKSAILLMLTCSLTACAHANPRLFNGCAWHNDAGSCMMDDECVWIVESGQCARILPR
jgi:hypothetical protein